MKLEIGVHDQSARHTSWYVCDVITHAQLPPPRHCFFSVVCQLPDQMKWGRYGSQPTLVHVWLTVRLQHGWDEHDGHQVVATAVEPAVAIIRQTIRITSATLLLRCILLPLQAPAVSFAVRQMDHRWVRYVERRKVKLYHSLYVLSSV